MLVLAAFRRDDLAANRFLEEMIKFDKPPRLREGFADQREIALEGLSSEDVARLAVEHGQAARASEIARESAGVPIFIDYLLESKSTAADGPTRAEPVSLSVELGRRIQRLPAEHRRLLQVVAIAGRPVAEPIATGAADIAQSAATVVADLRRQRFLRTMADDEELLVETYHDRLRDAVLRQLSETEIRGHTAALAEALERRGARDPEWLADLWSHAAQRQKAGEYSYLAADRAEQTLAFTNAVRLYRQALDRAPRSGAAEAEARQRLANALSHAGRSRESAEEYLRAAALCDVGGHRTPLPRRSSLFHERPPGRRHDDTARRFTGDWLAYPSGRWARSPHCCTSARLCFRGLSAAAAASQKSDPRTRLLLDVTWSAAAGLSLTAPLQAATFVSHYLRLALDADAREI